MFCNIINSITFCSMFSWCWFSMLVPQRFASRFVGLNTNSLVEMSSRHIYHIKHRSYFPKHCFTYYDHADFSQISKYYSNGYGIWHRIAWWRHQMETFSALLAIHRSPVNIPHKGQWRGSLMLSLVCAWINAWVNNRKTGDLRRHRAHYCVIVMGRRFVDENRKNYLVPIPAIWSEVVWWGFV